MRSSSCSICLVDFEPGARIAKVKSCGHTYHEVCLTTWLEQKNECPLCKASIDCYKADEFRQRQPDNLMELQAPVAVYFRELTDLMADVEALNNFHRRMRVDERRQRDYMMGVLALNLQLRQLQRTLVLNRHRAQIQALDLL